MSYDDDERPGDDLDFGGGGDFEYDDEDIEEYKTPVDDLEYGDGGGDDEFVADTDSRIDTGAEWNDYGDGASKSRVGIARAADIDEDIGTMMVDEKFKKMEQMSRTPEDMFRILARKIKERYDISDGVYDDSLRIMQYLNKQNRKLKFKNPAAIIFALLCIKDTKIDNKSIDKIYDEMAKHEKMNKTDLLRYIFFVQDVLKNR
ncbi:MAG: hypothetical protein PHG66_00455 [Candidatus Colwellbacteria bacterium]|nr:hypothetical protein [Candidatus Colwellbacteria bacterium]